MTSPSTRIWEQRDSLDDGLELLDFLPAQPRDPETLARTAERIAGGLPRRDAVADFLDDLRFARGTDDIARRIQDEPAGVDARTDAFLAALAEHVAVAAALAAPPWTSQPGRFLDHFWWPSSTVALHPQALVEAPAAFRRRGIFIAADSLRRV